MIAAQHRHRRDVDDRAAARLQQPEHLADRRPLVRLGQRIQHVERRDDVEAGAGKGNGGHAGAREARAARVTADAESGLGEVEPVGAAEAGEQCEVGAGAAAAIEQPRVRQSGGRALEQRRDECAEAAEPEVTRFRPCGCAQQVFHARIVSFPSWALD